MQTGRALRVDQHAIFRNLEDAAARTHQLHIGAWEFLLDPRLQLESPGTVASGITVFDSYVHAASPVRRRLRAQRRTCKKRHHERPFNEVAIMHVTLASTASPHLPRSRHGGYLCVSLCVVSWCWLSPVPKKVPPAMPI